MYRIIGGDQKEYGPVSAEQIRQWIAEGRANAQTKVQAEGSTDWKPLAEFLEFAGALGAGAAPTPPPGTAPAPFPSGPAPGVGPGAEGGREAALRAVKGPAIALIIIAAMGMAYYALNGVATLVGGGMMFQHSLPADMPPEVRAFFEGMHGPLAGAINLAIVALDAFVLFGAIKLMRLEAHGLAVAACIAAMLPCQCCCAFGLPFGIWALVVLNRPEVKSQFH